MRKLHFALIAALLLQTGALAVPRIWKDSTGAREIEAEFISLEDGVVSLLLANDKLARFPLDRLSDADQLFARDAAERLKVKIKARAVPIERTITKGVGKSERQTNLSVEVEMRRDDIAAAYVLREVELGEIVVDGKTLTLAESTPLENFYDTLAHDKSSTHPRGGIRLNFEFSGVPGRAKKVDTLTGLVTLHTGGDAGSVALGGLGSMSGNISDKTLREAGLQMSMKRGYFDTDLQLSATVKKSNLAFAGLELVGEDGRKNGPNFGRTLKGDRIVFAIQMPPARTLATQMRVYYREHGTELKVPFEIKDLEIER